MWPRGNYKEFSRSTQKSSSWRDEVPLQAMWPWGNHKEANTTPSKMSSLVVIMSELEKIKDEPVVEYMDDKICYIFYNI